MATWAFLVVQRNRKGLAGEMGSHALRLENKTAKNNPKWEWAMGFELGFGSNLGWKIERGTPFQKPS